jgi:SAM-dependent methyltransferase
MGEMTNIATGLQVHPSNAEMARAWDGDEGAFWAAHAEQFDRAVAGYHGPFLDAAAIGQRDQVLDIGCGTGQTTRDAARLAGAGGALGVDLSGEMILLARRLAAAENLANVRFEQADAQVYPFRPGSFDVAISRTGAMFFGDPAAAFANLARALRPGGRLTVLVWQSLDHNEWIRDFRAALAAGRDFPAPPTDRPGPFAFADPGRLTSFLAGAGFDDVQVQGIEAPMWFGTDPADAHRFMLEFMGWMLEGLDPAGRAGAAASLYTTLAAHDTGSGVRYDSAGWIISATRG